MGAYLPNDNQIGIGISLDNIKSKNPMNWTGQNLLGKALMDIRQQIRSEQEAVIQQEAEAQSAAKPRRFRVKTSSKASAPPVAAPAPLEPLEPLELVKPIDAVEAVPIAPASIPIPSSNLNIQNNEKSSMISQP